MSCPHCHGHARHCSCSACSIPERPCPPRCVANLEWKIGRGAAPEAVLVVRNAGAQARTFQFSATPLVGVSPGAAALSVAPASALLAPGESAVVNVRLDHSEALTPCQDYRAEIRVFGAFAQCVRVHCYVLPDAFDGCLVTQGGLHGLPFKWRRHARAARLHFEIDRGMKPRASISIRNAGDAERVFELEAGPLIGPQPGAAALVVTPTAVAIDPGKSAAVSIELVNSLALGPGQRYRAELSVRGYEEQRVLLCCHTRAGSAAHFELVQGEPPVRVRAHHWYDHFQCTEPCAIDTPPI